MRDASGPLCTFKTTGKGKTIRRRVRFPSPISALGVLRKLQEGEQRLSRFTVIEGWTRWDIADSLAHVEELQLRDSAEALKLMDDTSLIRDLDPSAENLEGYLFPATYSFPTGTKAPVIIETMSTVQSTCTQDGPRKRGRLKTSPQLVTSRRDRRSETEDSDQDRFMIYNRMQKNIARRGSTIITLQNSPQWRNEGKCRERRQSPLPTTQDLRGSRRDRSQFRR